jgi:hypothetical protein
MKRSYAACLAAALVGAGAAQAAEPTGSDFDLLEPAAAPAPGRSPEETERLVSRRRTLLTLHQTFGIVTLAGLAATVVVGQLNYNDIYGGGGNTKRFDVAHNLLALGTTLSFLATGLLALFAPQPYPRKGERFDTVSAHKLAMLIATVLMAGEFALGILVGEGVGHLDPRALAVTHLVLGYGSFAAMSFGSIVLVF